MEYRSKLYVIGAKGVGKTSIINALTRADKDFTQRIAWYEMKRDWKIRHGNYAVDVDIKEVNSSNSIVSVSREFLLFSPAVYIVIINNTLKNRISSSDDRLLKRMAVVDKKCPIIVILNGSNDEGRGIERLGEKYNYIRYWFGLPLLDLSQDTPRLDDVRRTISQIIINASTDRLSYVKNLIDQNIVSKERVLDIGMCNITSLYEIENIFNCTHLEQLIISNEWGFYSKGKWIRKESKNTQGRNVLFDLPEELEKLKNLKVLICGGDWNSKNKKINRSERWGIRRILCLSKLIDLEDLNLSNNKISDAIYLSRLHKLKKLHLNNNRIIRFPTTSNFPLLKELNLSNNRISDVSFINESGVLKTLDLHSNEISELLPLKDLISKIGISNYKWRYNSICVYNNPLASPPSVIVAQGKSATIKYFDQILAAQKFRLEPFYNKNIKLVLVGNSHVGKSTLVHWLKEQKILTPPISTHWMIPESWNATHKEVNYNVRIFDFGGQEYYHDTHHLFFTNRTAYLILWEKNSNKFGEIEVDLQQIFDASPQKTRIQTFPIEYWLEAIEYHTSRKKNTEVAIELQKLLEERDVLLEKEIYNFDDNSNNQSNDTKEKSNDQIEEQNVLIIQSKVDNGKAKAFLDQWTIKNNYSNVFDFTSISTHNNIGIDLFKDVLFDMFDNMKIVTQKYVGTWKYIKEQIECELFNHSLDIDEFRDYCNDIIRKIPELSSTNKFSEFLFNINDTKLFTSYLNDIGLVLYFPENLRLSDRIFLNQKVLLEGIYKILVEAYKLGGEFALEVVEKSIGEGMGNKLETLVDLMIHFKIIFEHPSKSKTYIAPLYLPKDPPQNVSLFLSLFIKPEYRFKYKTFIHKNVILDFFQSYGKNALKESVSDNLYFFWKNGLILKNNTNNDMVLVQFCQNSSQETGAFIDVSPSIKTKENKFLEEIIQNLDRINEGWGVTKMVTSNGVDFVPLDQIISNENEENWVFKCGNKYFKLVDFKKHLTKKNNMKRIFISYSKQDLSYVNKFIEHLSALQLDGKVSHWYCSDLDAGDVWDEKIQKQLDQADIVCFMISPNFMKTKYIHDYEIPGVIERYDSNKDVKIVPIILDFCRWTTQENDLGRFTALPFTAKPVADFINQNMAWYLIQESIRTIINQDIQPEGNDFYTNQHLPKDVRELYTRIIEGKINRNSGDNL